MENKNQQSLPVQKNEILPTLLHDQHQKAPSPIIITGPLLQTEDHKTIEIAPAPGDESAP